MPRVLPVLALCLLALAGGAEAKLYFSQKEGLELAFPDAERVERRNFVLEPAQVDAVEQRSKAPLDSPIVSVHVGLAGERVLGYAFIDVHTVRTLPEALMVVLEPGGRVRRVEVLAFHEPEDYLPGRRWLSQFEGKRLDADLQIKRDIDAISGATLSSRATTRSVRRALALYELLIADDGTDAAGDE